MENIRKKDGHSYERVSVYFGIDIKRADEINDCMYKNLNLIAPLAIEEFTRKGHDRIRDIDITKCETLDDLNIKGEDITSNVISTASMYRSVINAVTEELDLTDKEVNYAWYNAGLKDSDMYESIAITIDRINLSWLVANFGLAEVKRLHENTIRKRDEDKLKGNKPLNDFFG